MVDQLPLRAAENPTLDDVWSGLAARMPRRAAVAMTALGLAAAGWSRWLDLPWVATLAAVVVAAFGCEALLRSRTADGHARGGRSARVARIVARAAAAIAAVGIGLVMLGVIFGDKIEVMRR